MSIRTQNLPKVFSAVSESTARSDADNATREPGFRPSRAGLPLIHLFLEDFVFPHIPMPAETKSKSKFVDSELLETTMNIAIGHLYEGCVRQQLEEYCTKRGWLYYGNHTMIYRGMRGECDHMLKGDGEVIIVENKAIRVYSIANASESKLMTDDWGYMTQLAIYMAAADTQFPAHLTKGRWLVYAKGTLKHIEVEFEGGMEFAYELADAAVERMLHYNNCKQMFEAGAIDDCISYLLKNTENIPERKLDKRGMAAYNSNSFQYLPQAADMLRTDGTLRKRSELTPLLKQMVTKAYSTFLTTPNY